MKKLLYIFFLLIATVKINYAQSVYIKVGDWGVATTNLLDGKIKYESLSGDTPFSTSVTFQRFEGSTQVRVQAIYVFEANGTQVNISDSIFVNTADFTHPNFSKAFIKTATLKSNNKNGIVKLKWRYLDNYSGGSQWSGFHYASKTYGTINTAKPADPPYPKVNIYQYMSNKFGDHYYSTSYGPTAGNGDWIYETVAFYAYKTQIESAVPIYQYMSNKFGDHYYSTVYGPTAGNGDWIYETIAFYAYKTQVPGTVPVYQYMNTKIGDHYYSTVYGPTAGNGDWIYETIAFYAFPKTN